MKGEIVNLSEDERNFIIHVLQSAIAAFSGETAPAPGKPGEDSGASGKTPSCRTSTEGSVLPSTWKEQIETALETFQSVGNSHPPLSRDLPRKLRDVILAALGWYVAPSLDREAIERYVNDMVSDMSSCSPVMSTDLEFWREDGAKLREKNRADALNLLSRFEAIKTEQLR